MQDTELVELIKKKIEYKYEYSSLQSIRAKRGASEVEDNLNLNFFASSRPAFLDKKGLTPAQRGTAMHLFMQFSDYISAKDDLESEIEKLKNNLDIISSSEIDGLILSDIGLIEDAVSHGLEAHVSVQENVTNSHTLKTLHKLGAKRAILSRELSIEEIAEITDKSPIETEIFIHGAICFSFSNCQPTFPIQLSDNSFVGLIPPVLKTTAFLFNLFF